MTARTAAPSSKSSAKPGSLIPTLPTAIPPMMSASAPTANGRSRKSPIRCISSPSRVPAMGPSPSTSPNLPFPSAKSPKLAATIWASPTQAKRSPGPKVPPSSVCLSIKSNSPLPNPTTTQSPKRNPPKNQNPPKAKPQPKTPSPAIKRERQRRRQEKTSQAQARSHRRQSHFPAPHSSGHHCPARRAHHHHARR